MVREQDETAVRRRKFSGEVPRTAGIEGRWAPKGLFNMGRLDHFAC
jgi:hypothetical protein